MDVCAQIKSVAIAERERLVGDIGEVLAANHYRITLYDKNEPDYDAETDDGKKVQIKATFQDALTFKKVPDYYLGLKVDPDGSCVEIYNGPGRYIEEKFKYRAGFGEVLLRFPNKDLKEISGSIPAAERIERRAE